MLYIVPYGGGGRGGSTHLSYKFTLTVREGVVKKNVGGKGDNFIQVG